jgi:hypothetical protein
MPTFASAQNVDHHMADRVLGNAELEPWKRRGMASVDDARCAGRHDNQSATDETEETLKIRSTGSWLTTSPLSTASLTSSAAISIAVSD